MRAEHITAAPPACARLDIGEREKTEERFQLVVEAAPNAMIMVGADGLITLVNTQTEKLFGYDRRELLGQPIEMLVPERFRANHGCQRRSFFAAPTLRAMGAGRDLFGVRSDGAEVPIEIGLNPIHTLDGQCVLASIIDITGRKKTEERFQLMVEELRRSLLEKTTLLKEVHHRVKNNLQVICSLLSMQIDSVEGAVTEPLLEAHRRVLTMSLIHQELYQSDTLSDLDFGQFIRLLSEQIFATYSAYPSRIELDLRVEPIHLSVDTAIPCGLILNELMSNALKHAFKDGRQGVLRVCFKQVEPGRIELSVADDGVGLPANFRFDEARSLGVQVVRALVKQLGADLTITSSGGTEFALRWPSS